MRGATTRHLSPQAQREEVGVNNGSSQKSHSLTFWSCDCTAEYGIQPVQIWLD